MIFTRSGQYHELSDDGRYSIAAYRTGDGKFLFQAFRLTPKHPGEVFYTSPDIAMCREACEKDAKGMFPVKHENGDGV